MLLNSVQFVFKYFSSQLNILTFKVDLPNKHFKQWHCILNLELCVTDGDNINHSWFNHQTLWEGKKAWVQSRLTFYCPNNMKSIPIPKSRNSWKQNKQNNLFLAFIISNKSNLGDKFHFILEMSSVSLFLLVEKHSEQFLLNGSNIYPTVFHVKTWLSEEGCFSWHLSTHLSYRGSLPFLKFLITEIASTVF